MLRPADQIDITEVQLRLIKEIFDNLARNGPVTSVAFFLAIRKNPKMRQMATAIAREPEGNSRIPSETFQ